MFRMQVLHVKPFWCFEFAEDDDNSEDEEMEGDFWGRGQRRRLESALELVLQNGYESLECIDLDCPYPLGRLCHPPLCSLHRLMINNTGWGPSADPDSVWNAIASINFQRAMPYLKEVQIYLGATSHRLAPNCNHQTVWPAVNSSLVPHCSGTVRKLELSIQCQQINMKTLQAVTLNSLMW